MAMAKGAVLVAVLAAMAALAQLEAATVHPVGGAGKNWDTSGDYDTWSAQQTFTQGDSLVFTYPSSHDVVQTTKAGYDACSAGSTDKSFTGGKTTIKLSTAGKQYFICGVPGHCAAGMKLAVNVVAAATPAAKAPAKPRGQRTVAPVAAPATAPAPVSTDDQLPTVTSPTGSPTPKPSAASSINAGAKAGVALAIAMAAALAM